MACYVKNPSKIEIRDGKIYGISMSGAFTVALKRGGIPQVQPTVTVNGWRLEDLLDFFWDTFKVKSRAATLKDMSEEEIKEFTSQTRDVREYLSKTARKVVAIEVEFDDLTADEQRAYIEGLQNRMSE